MTSSNIINKLDELLKDDRNFDTRAGLRFMAELVRDAFEFIEEEREKNVADADALKSFSTRIGHVENGLNDFLKMRAREQESAAAERTFYRRAVIGGIITILLGQIAQWLLG